MNNRLSRVLLAVAMLIASSLACNALGGPLLEDNFEGSDSNWGTGTDADSSVEYSDGGLRTKIFTQNYFVWSTPNDQDYENVHVEVTVKNNETDSTTAFGVLCHQQAVTDSFYYFVITPSREYAIAKAALAQTDVFLTNDDQWAQSDAIAENAASYRVGADCGNGTLALYVDGQQIASVSDSTYVNGGVGVLVWSGEEVASGDVTFDDFVVTKLAQ
ncbi:MAG TPA: hypothetical protein VFR47_33915 [Anaerolineales bacterium]|nr:hypothetical protein [Anaerolineales bacterium]